MKRVFISYASEERPLATEIALALKGAGYEIWSDFERLQPGDGFREEIAEGIAKSDCAVFVMCAHSVTDGSFVLTEMGHAQEKWPYPIGHILTVQLADVEVRTIPVYLREATLLQQKGAGDIPSEVVRAVGRLHPPIKWRIWIPAIATTVLAMAIALWAWPDTTRRLDPVLTRAQKYQAQLQLLASRTRRPLPLIDCNSNTSRAHSIELRNSPDVRAAFQFLRDSSQNLEPPANTSLDSTNLQGMVFKGLNLRGIHFNHACIDSANFQDAKLAGATFDESSGEAAIFTRAQLDSSSFSKTRLPRASFFGACLRRSAFPGALLEGATFRFADIGWASFYSSKLTDSEGWERGDSAKSHAFFVTASGLTDEDAVALRASGAVLNGLDYGEWRDQQHATQLSESTVSACQAHDRITR